MTVFKNILVPTDFGDASRRAEDLACELAGKSGGKITVLHVWSLPTPAYAETVTLPLTEIESAARDALEQDVARVRERHGEVQSVLVAGVPWRAIVDAVTENDYDLVVIGTHGRTGVPRFFLGSVAEKVVRASPVPVLTVHARDEKSTG